VNDELEMNVEGDYCSESEKLSWNFSSRPSEKLEK
jgi:hypothetical protein